ncbi:4-coumarate--CoA ligase-like 5 [Ananas comosus]|uniref:4-coumarate--CoA ligase n=1 Tax=Ananas comosus TaxID=4615 RepID=A0A6P5H1V5_ANACO|nr:4-coumarate--CoA ligase-like 5 [Ananas comosus]
MASTTTDTTTSSTSSSSSSSSTPLLSPPTPPPPPPPSIDPKSGFCAATQTFRSLLPAPAALPPASLPLSLPSFLLSLLPSPPPSSHPALIDAASGRALSFPALLSQSRSLAAALRRSISHGDVAFVLSPPRLDVPVLYLALLSLGVVVSPANPVSTSPEISRLVGLSRPSVAFVTSSTAHKLPSNLPTILLDSPRFRSFLQISESYPTVEAVVIRQSDSAAILYSSGTTGRVKGVLLTHRNLISVTALLIGPPLSPPPPPATSAGATTTTLLTVPLFHVYGFMLCLKSVAAGETAAIQTERFDAKRTLAIVERFRITHLALAPPAVLALVRIREAEDAAEDVSSLQAAFCGGAPIGTDLIRRFSSVFPNVRLIPVSSLTD